MLLAGCGERAALAEARTVCNAVRPTTGEMACKGQGWSTGSGSDHLFSAGSRGGAITMALGPMAFVMVPMRVGSFDQKRDGAQGWSVGSGLHHLF